MDVDKRRSDMKAFISSYFNYWPLLWMLQNRGLATEICKVKHRLSPQIINNVFELKSVPYYMRRQDLFLSRNVHSVHHGTDSLTYLGSKIWAIVPQVIKNSESLSVFENSACQ